MKFAAVDVETANRDMSSICSIGIATFEDGRLASEWYSLVDPKDEFYPFFVSIHGIEERDVRGQPTFGEIGAEIENLLGNTIVVSHTYFDRTAIHKAADRWLVSPPCCTWVDSCRVARMTWPQWRGHGLAAVCKRIGYSFRHHHALEDAKAAGHIVLAAMRKRGIDIRTLLKGM